jgi:hypothetical protein
MMLIHPSGMAGRRALAAFLLALHAVFLAVAARRARLGRRPHLLPTLFGYARDRLALLRGNVTDTAVFRRHLSGGTERRMIVKR